jgi:hypothetical protein
MTKDKTIPADRLAKNALADVTTALDDVTINSDARAELEAAKRALTRAVDKLPSTDDPVTARGPGAGDGGGGGEDPPVSNK